MMSRWSARQRVLLGEMRVRLWVPHQSSDVADRPGPAGDDSDALARQGIAGNSGVQAAGSPIMPRTAASPEPVPRLQQIRGMDWPTLRAAVAACTACPLCNSRTNPVFGIGNPKARWMIVGEAPGEQEDLRGEPFVGKSGQLLDSMLAALQLTRSDGSAERQVYIANTLKCRPPGNRNPAPDELAQCEPFLVRQIELVQPSVIVAMGRFAVQALLRSHDPIGRLRGRVHLYRDVPLVVTYHPAYLLRNLLDKARAWEDLCLAREIATGALRKGT
jgi:uracil-DNA glycosylase